MRIGILTYCKVANFGANLQALSTYLYLTSKGHDPYLINYMVKEQVPDNVDPEQFSAHINIINEVIKKQTKSCFSVDQIYKEVLNLNLDAIIVGSDAVLQHHPILSRLRRGRLKPIRLIPVSKDRMFPNAFWGVGIADKIPMALISASSQNSNYMLFGKRTKEKMAQTLSLFKNICVRDSWTMNMIHEIDPLLPISKTPDPVFAFNHNAENIIPTKEYIMKHFGIPENYILFSTHNAVIEERELVNLVDYYNGKGWACVFLPIPDGINCEQHCNFQLRYPISPLEWYAIIANSKAYIGSNMHPIVVSLHNAVPCFSIDNWGRTNFWGRKIKDDSSKILDILSTFGVGQNHRFINNGRCIITAKEIM